MNLPAFKMKVKKIHAFWAHVRTIHGLTFGLLIYFLYPFFGKHIPHRKTKQKKRPLLEIFSPIPILHSVQGLSAIKCTNPGEKGGGLVSFESGSSGRS